MPAAVDSTANPAPLGLLGFGVTTVILSFHNADFFALGSMILGMGIFYGGVAQILAGLMEWKKNNTFGMTAFLSYGLFWLSFSASLIIPKMGWGEATTDEAMTAYLAVWGIFTALMFIGTLRINRALQAVFASLTVLFFLLAFEHMLDEGDTRDLIGKIAGYEGILCGALAVYTGMAQVLNEVWGKDIFSLWPVKK